MADHMWKDKSAAIAKRVDNLGDQFHQAMQAGWLAYITKTYLKESVFALFAGPALGQGDLVMEEENA